MNNLMRKGSENYNFIICFIECGGNISKMEKHGYSYKQVKSKLSELGNYIEHNKRKNFLKEYLDILVQEDILLPSIAEVILKKHKEVMDDVI